MDDNEWLAGVKLWYNDQDYLGAIQVWQDLLDALDWGTTGNFEKGNPSEDELASPFAVLKHRVPYGLDVARRLLFLAGCQLDVPNVKLARQSLLRCLRCFNDNEQDWDSQLARLALQEWLCSYDDETHVNNDDSSSNSKNSCSDDRNDDKQLNMACRIVEYAMQRGCRYWKFALQRPGFLDTSLLLLQDSKPFYKPDEHPSWCQILEQNWETIRDEFYRLARQQQRQRQEYQRGRSSSTTISTTKSVDDDCNYCQHWPAVGSGDHRGGAGQHDHKVVDGDWREVVLFGAGAQPELAPFTSTLIQSHISDVTTLAEQGGGEIIFSVLGNNTRIRPHCGTTNIRLTAHLGLSIPSTSSKECGIRVGDEWHSWENGRVMVFDDSFEHEVRNLTPHYRAVLLLRFWNPNLKQDKRVSALSEAVDSKDFDAIRRYNPPLPSSLSASIEERVLERSRCAGCWRNGYSSIRMVQSSFSCICGRPIV